MAFGTLCSRPPRRARSRTLQALPPTIWKRIRPTRKANSCSCPSFLSEKWSLAFYSHWAQHLQRATQRTNGFPRRQTRSFGPPSRIYRTQRILRGNRNSAPPRTAHQNPYKCLDTRFWFWSQPFCLFAWASAPPPTRPQRGARNYKCGPFGFIKRRKLYSKRHPYSWRRDLERPSLFLVEW